MKSLLTRLEQLEADRLSRTTVPMSAEQSGNWLRQQAEHRGLSEDDVIKRHGGWPGFAHWLLHEPRPTTEWNDGMSAQERYMRMLNG